MRIAFDITFELYTNRPGERSHPSISPLPSAPTKSRLRLPSMLRSWRSYSGPTTSRIHGFIPSAHQTIAPPPPSYDNIILPVYQHRVASLAKGFERHEVELPGHEHKAFMTRRMATRYTW